MKFSSFSTFVFLMALVGCTDPASDQTAQNNFNERESNQSNNFYTDEKTFGFENLTENKLNGTFSRNAGQDDLTSSMAKKPGSSTPRDGLFKEYFEDGSIREETEYSNGVKTGTRKIWYRSGQLFKSGMMKNDRWHGKYEEWYEDGTPKLAGQYLEGLQEGVWVFFDQEGNSLPNLHFENGIEITRKLPLLQGD